jgi:hypothetical protein
VEKREDFQIIGQEQKQSMQNNISKQIEKYKANEISLLDIVEYLQKIPYNERDRLDSKLQNLIQFAELMYEDYIEGFLELDANEFDNEIKAIENT